MAQAGQCEEPRRQQVAGDPDEPCREQDAEAAADCGEQRALGEELADETPARRAEG